METWSCRAAAWRRLSENDADNQEHKAERVPEGAGSSRQCSGGRVPLGLKPVGASCLKLV